MSLVFSGVDETVLVVADASNDGLLYFFTCGVEDCEFVGEVHKDRAEEAGGVGEDETVVFGSDGLIHGSDEFVVPGVRENDDSEIRERLRGDITLEGFDGDIGVEFLEVWQTGLLTRGLANVIMGEIEIGAEVGEFDKGSVADGDRLGAS